MIDPMYIESNRQSNVRKYSPAGWALNIARDQIININLWFFFFSAFPSRGDRGGIPSEGGNTSTHTHTHHMCAVMKSVKRGKQAPSYTGAGVWGEAMRWKTRRRISLLWHTTRHWLGLFIFLLSRLPRAYPIRIQDGREKRWDGPPKQARHPNTD